MAGGEVGVRAVAMLIHPAQVSPCPFPEARAHTSRPRYHRLVSLPMPSHLTPHASRPSHSPVIPTSLLIPLDSHPRLKHLDALEPTRVHVALELVQTRARRSSANIDLVRLADEGKEGRAGTADLVLVIWL